MNSSNARQHIVNATTAGVISGVITLIVTLVSMAGGKVLEFSAWNLLDVALIFGLTYGIYKNRRICAVSMLIYFLFSKIYLAVTLKQAPSFLAYIFIYYFFQGVRGTFAYHRLVQEKS